MTDFTVKLTPNIVNPGSEGSLDTSLLNGKSIQRTAAMMMFTSGDDIKMIVASKDGDVVNNIVEGNEVIADVTATEPTVTTDDLTVFSLNCHVYGTVVSEGTSEVTEYGFVYAANTDNPTTANNKVVIGSESFTGSFDDTIDVGFQLDGVDLDNGDNPVWFAAYATNSVGTSYGAVLQTDPNPWLCLMEGTLIALADGSYKKIEDIGYDDTLLVWNFDEARLDGAKPVWIMKPFSAPRYSVVSFSDGSELGTIDDGKGHSIFNAEKGGFTHMVSNSTPLGTTTYTKSGENVEVTGKKIVHERTRFYNVITNIHMNVFANGILTSTGLNNIYPIADMKFVKTSEPVDQRYDGIPNELVTGLRLAEQTADVSEKVLRMKKHQL